MRRHAHRPGVALPLVTGAGAATPAYYQRCGTLNTSFSCASMVMIGSLSPGLVYVSEGAPGEDGRGRPEMARDHQQLGNHCPQGKDTCSYLGTERRQGSFYRSSPGLTGRVREKKRKIFVGWQLFISRSPADEIIGILCCDPLQDPYQKCEVKMSRRSNPKKKQEGVTIAEWLLRCAVQ